MKEQFRQSGNPNLGRKDTGIVFLRKKTKQQHKDTPRTDNSKKDREAQRLHIGRDEWAKLTTSGRGRQSDDKDRK